MAYLPSNSLQSHELFKYTPQGSGSSRRSSNTKSEPKQKREYRLTGHEQVVMKHLMSSDSYRDVRNAFIAVLADKYNVTIHEIIPSEYSILATPR